MQTNATTRQRGIVSLLTTVIVSTLLLIITTSMAALMTGELHQATDSDQSAKAYFAAESGIEDALQRIKPLIKSGQSISNDGTCVQPALNTSAIQDPLGLAVTCERVVELTNALAGKLDRDAARQIELLGATGMNQVDLYWNIDPRFTPVGGDALAVANMATMEVLIAGYDRVVNLGPGNIDQLKTVTIRPGANATPTSNIGINAIQTASCVTPPQSATYNCHFTMTGFNGTAKNYVIRLKTRNAGTHFSLRPLAGGATVTVPDNYITVDVTASSGEVYRRIVRKIPRSAGLVSGLEFVLFSDTEICKKFGVVDTAGVPNVQYPGCPAFP